MVVIMNRLAALQQQQVQTQGKVIANPGRMIPGDNATFHGVPHNYLDKAHCHYKR